jgi:hypothetical protein
MLDVTSLRHYPDACTAIISRPGTSEQCSVWRDNDASPLKLQ